MAKLIPSLMARIGVAETGGRYEAELSLRWLIGENGSTECGPTVEFQEVRRLSGSFVRN